MSMTREKEVGHLYLASSPHVVQAVFNCVLQELVDTRVLASKESSLRDPVLVFSPSSNTQFLTTTFEAGPR
jgi:hypothetical protein